jgi:hypothetical protein
MSASRFWEKGVERIFGKGVRYTENGLLVKENGDEKGRNRQELARNK